MLVNVRLGMLHGDGPLLVPPVGHCQNATIDHAEPELTPQVNVNFHPIAIVVNFFGIKHERAVHSSAGYITLNAGFLDDDPVALGQFLAELADVYIVFAGEYFTESGETGGHGEAIGVVGSTM